MTQHISMWMKRPDILSYIIDCYAGLEPTEGGGPSRRVFLWEDGSNVMMGNTEAFLQHLERQFELIPHRGGASMMHALLRELGEAAQQHKPHAPRGIADRPYKSPDAEEWIVGRVEPFSEEDPTDA